MDCQTSYINRYTLVLLVSVVQFLRFAWEETGVLETTHLSGLLSHMTRLGIKSSCRLSTIHMLP